MIPCYSIVIKIYFLPNNFNPRRGGDGAETFRSLASMVAIGDAERVRDFLGRGGVAETLESTAVLATDVASEIASGTETVLATSG